MALSRFGHVSPYKNLMVLPKKDSAVSEIPVSTTASDSADLISATSSFWVAKGQLICLPYHASGKRANKVPGFVACPGGVSDFGTSPFNHLLAAGSEKGTISVFKLPSTIDPLEYNPYFEICAHFAQGSLSGGKPVDRLSFHPTSHALLAACSGSDLAIWDLLGGSSAKPAIHFNLQSALWDIKWSWGGDLLAGTTKAGILSVWDPRAPVSLVGECVTHGVAGRKCSRLSWIEGNILTTGVNKLGERECSLYDPRALSKGPFMTQQIDNSTGVLIPIVDPNRSIVYLAGRGESFIRWFDISSAAPSKVELQTARLADPVADMVMAPINHSTVNVMQAELCKLLVLSKNHQILPVVIQAMKRQYLDFHADVMPPVRSMIAAQSSLDWVNGGNKPIQLVSQDPAASQTPHANPRAELSLLIGEPQVQPSHSSSVPHSTPLSNSEIQQTRKSDVAKTPEEPTDSSIITASMQPQTNASPPPISTLNITSLAREAKPPGVPPRWSRKFLTGKTPMKTDYEDLQNLSSTFVPDRELVKCTPRFFYLPLGGPGGKLAVVPVEKKGRLATHLPALLNGATVMGFAVDLLVEGRVFVAGDDSKVRVFQVPNDGLTSDTADFVMALSEARMDRICVIQSHPIAKDILLTISDDRGSPTARIWNLGHHLPIAPSRSILLSSDAISSASWSLDGSLIAITTKTGKIHVLDPRNDDGTESWCTGVSHDSARSVQIAWVDDETHILTAGFSGAAMREVKLYNIDQSQRSISAIARIEFDISPSPLFIHFDPDISVGFCWSKGERTMHLIEVVLEDDKPGRIEALSASVYSTTHSGYAFFPKQLLDVSRVEVDRALRLTPNSVEVVSFSVPRSKPEFFQDDIYPPTRHLLSPSYETGEAWLEGNRRSATSALRRVDLKPEGMLKLSEAPASNQVKAKQNILISSGPRLTDSQKQEQYLENLFRSAKRGPAKEGDKRVLSDEEDDEEIVGKSRVGAPVDDDW